MKGDQDKSLKLQNKSAKKIKWQKSPKVFLLNDWPYQISSFFCAALSLLLNFQKKYLESNIFLWHSEDCPTPHPPKMSQFINLAFYAVALDLLKILYIFCNHSNVFIGQVSKWHGWLDMQWKSNIFYGPLQGNLWFGQKLGVIV